MKGTIKTIFLISALLTACEDQDYNTIKPTQPVDDLPPASAIASFASSSEVLSEDDPDQRIISVALSKAAPTEGVIVIKLVALSSQQAIDFETSPAAINSEISLPVAKDALSVNFTIKALQNTIVNNDREIRFVMDRATGGVSTGPNNSITIQIQDDELAWRLKKFETLSGSWRSERAFTYGQFGEISKINWLTATPFETRGSYSYQYEGNKLVQMIDQSGAITRYQWANDHVEKSEKYLAEKLIQRIEYGYDDAGNVGEMVLYDRQPDGTLQQSTVFIFLYYKDGNIYKKLTYFISQEEELILSSTQTYGDYLNKVNPAPMIETLSHLNAQPNLPRTYRVETGDQVLEYQIHYQFRADGLVLQRKVTGANGSSETTNYTYY